MNDDHKIEKPVVFLSHASSDAPFANAVMTEIQKVFAGGVEVFCTSSPGAIAVGRDWLTDIEEKLGISKAVIAIVTPVSIERPWLWFEIGATWSKGREGACKIYPLCAKEVDLTSLPSPLDRLQALSLGKAADLKMLFEALTKQFGFGDIKSFKASNIISRIPKYDTITIDPVDEGERVFYAGKYKGYSEDEIIDIINEYYVLRHSDSDREYLSGRGNNLFHGMLIHFRNVDKKLDLPPGTAKKYLTSIVASYNFIPEKETSNTVRYMRDSDDEEYEDEEDE